MSSNEKFEREFAAFLSEEDSRLAALYRKLPQTEPDPRLDASVRAMAHRALNPELVATPPSTLQRRRARWLPALGAAAGIVFAAGIAFRLGPSWHGDRGETGAPVNDVINVRPIDAPPMATPPLSPPPPPQAETSAAPARAASGASPGKMQAQAAAEAPRPASEPSVREKAATLDDGADNHPAAAGALGKAERPAAGGTQAQAFPGPAQARKRAAEIDAVERKQIMATGAWQNLHDRDTAASRQAASPPADSRAPAAHAKAAEPQRTDESRTNPVAAPPPTAAPARPAEQARPSPSAAATLKQSVPAPAAGAPAAPSSALKTEADSQAGFAREEASAPVSADKAIQKKDNGKVRSHDPNASLYPEHWLENIRIMLRENNRDDALRSLAEFRVIYPDYHLPDDLRDLK